MIRKDSCHGLLAISLWYFTNVASFRHLQTPRKGKLISTADFHLSIKFDTIMHTLFMSFNDDLKVTILECRTGPVADLDYREKCWVHFMIQKEEH